jgi:hypothetical protein
VDQLAASKSVVSHHALPHRPCWVDIAISVRTADILPSHTTRVATGIAHAARVTPACAGSGRGNGNCCPPAMSTWSSHSRENDARRKCEPRHRGAQYAADPGNAWRRAVASWRSISRPNNSSPRHGRNAHDLARVNGVHEVEQKLRLFCAKRARGCPWPTHLSERGCISACKNRVTKP